jgi:hypothetical protein
MKNLIIDFISLIIDFNNLINEILIKINDDM